MCLKPNESRKQLTAWVSEDLHKKVVGLSDVERVSTSFWVKRAIEHYLNNIIVRKESVS